MRSLHKRTRQEGLPMLQVAQHIIQVNHTVSNLQSRGSQLILSQLKHFVALGLELVEVDSSAVILDEIDGSSVRGPREISIVSLVPPQVLRMKFSRVLDCQNQINSGLSLHNFGPK